MDKVARLRPRSVLDVGVGYGKWGLLARETLDWMPGRLDRKDWEIRIDGIEVFPYESPLHSWVYDEVRFADVLDVQESIEGYDLVMMNDVIEHIEKDIAFRLLRHLVARNKNVVISTPVHFFEQEIGGNEHEHHISHWDIADFAEFTFDADVTAKQALVVTLAGADAKWPTAKDSRASRIYNTRVAAVPAAAALAKQVTRKALR